MRWFVLVAMLLSVAWPAARVSADPLDWPVAGGRYFTQTGGYVVDNSAGQPFWSTYQSLGGPNWLGYPLSRRFAWRGATVQVFQRGVLGVDPTTGAIEPLNLLDLLSDVGLDDTLAAQFGVPRVQQPGEGVDAASIAWLDECVPCRRMISLAALANAPQSEETSERESWLAAAPALAAFYDRAPNALRLLGLPTSRPQDFGCHTAVRLQRGVLQLWQGTFPWAARGQITVANVGEVARALGVFGAGEHLAPEQRADPASARAASSPAPQPPRAGTAPGTRGAGGAAPITAGRAESGVVALTFDLGIPTVEAIPSVLDTLERYGVHATFFITGAWAEKQPDLLRRIVAAGHELANHSYSHPDLRKLSDAGARWEIERTEELALSLGGQTTRPYFRPPFGAYDGRLLDLVNAAGYRVVMWTLDSTDWRPESTAATVARRVGTRSDAGDIVVMHGYVAKTAQALPAILDQLAARGLRAGSLGDVLRGE